MVPRKWLLTPLRGRERPVDPWAFPGNYKRDSEVACTGHRGGCRDCSL